MESSIDHLKLRWINQCKRPREERKRREKWSKIKAKVKKWLSMQGSILLHTNLATRPDISSPLDKQTMWYGSK